MELSKETTILFPPDLHERKYPVKTADSFDQYQRKGSRFRQTGLLVLVTVLLLTLMFGCAVMRPERSPEELDRAHRTFIQQLIADRGELSRTVVRRILMEKGSSRL